MRRKNLDLSIALGITIVNVLWVLFAGPANSASSMTISIILALPIILIIPGYLLTEVFFQNRSLEPVQQLAFSLALSLALTILSGFILNLLPEGLRILPWAIWLGLLTVVLASLAYLRRRSQPVTAQQPQRFHIQISALILFGLALLVVVLSVAYSIIGAEEQSYSSFTNLWILPATRAGNTCAVSVSMQSFESTSVTYRVVMTTNQVQTASWAPVSLAPQQRWTQLEAVPVSATSTSLYVLVQIYRLDQPQTVYRHVDLTLHVASKGNLAKECTMASVFPSYGGSIAT